MYLNKNKILNLEIFFLSELVFYELSRFEYYALYEHTKLNLLITSHEVHD